MPKRSLPKRSEVDQLDRAITELLAKPNAKPETGDSELMPLLRIAAQLHQLPREDFKARLKSDLERKSSMATTTEAIAAVRTSASPRLSFKNAAKAIEFYKKTLGANVTMLMRFKDSPEPPPPGCGPTDPSKVMHAQFQIGETVVMASDGRATGNPKFEGFALSLSLPTPADVEKAFKALADGGKVEMPLEKTFFSARFGMVVDKFGVFWMVLVTPEPMK